MVFKQWEEFSTQHIVPLIRREGLPESFLATVQEHYLYLAQRIARHQQAADRPLIIGINGAQGTGKSTLTAFLEVLLSRFLGIACIGFSLDDLYRTRSERRGLAETVHPLLMTRGVPGTHDLTLGQTTIEALISARPDETVRIPVFNKAIDDRAPPEEWRRQTGPVSVVLIEGWCVGAIAETDADKLAMPINELEREADSQGRWRQYVNQQLEQAYDAFFQRLDQLIMLRAPSMDCIVEWRQLQEQKLVDRVIKDHFGAEKVMQWDEDERFRQAHAHSKGIMTAEEIKRFIMHYERLTRRMLEEMPSRADVVLEMNQQHAIVGRRSSAGMEA